MAKISVSLSARKKHTNNAPAAAAAKVQIRANVLSMIGADQARVFDAFAGDGFLWRKVWHAAAAYTGCDLQFYRDERRAFVCDNLRVLRAVDLGQFNIFDLDAYGSPWEQAYIVAKRRKIEPGERLGLLLTEGSGLGMKMGSISHALCKLAGFKPGTAGVHRGSDEIYARAIVGLTDLMGVDIVRRWEAHGKTGARMRYIGLVLEGQKNTPAA